MADPLKAEGNRLFAAKSFDEAVTKFSEAIELEPQNHVLYSNRSGAYASLKQFGKALEDATKTTEIKPDWAKGWSRKGSALHGTGDLVGAVDAFEKAIEIDSTNAQAQSGLAAVRRAIEAEAQADGADPTGGLGNMFNDPNMMQKLSANPKTKDIVSDPAFMQKLQQIKSDPSKMGEAMGDPRFLSVMSVLLGLDISMGNPDGTRKEEDTAMPDAGPRTETKAAEPEPEAEPESEEDKAAREAKITADEEKALGTTAYKKREFDTAIAHYQKAWDTHKDITYLTNMSAAKFEQGDYQGAIETCEQAIEYGREVLSDFKIMAKAYGRIGSSYERLSDLEKAIINYQKSLTEHRTPEILGKLRAAEKAKSKQEKDAYLDPAKAEEARELGSQKFKDADWPAAVEAYSEMIKRAPDDARGYSNRAACFIKLLGFPSAVTDCETAIEKDPKFVRAYLRKAQALFAMREYNKCIDTCTAATQVDVDGKNAREIEQQIQKAMGAQYSAQEGETEEQTSARIQRDPEIMGILQDPVMQSILQQSKENPAALQEHMKNPDIGTKIRKLMSAGVIRMGSR